MNGAVIAALAACVAFAASGAYLARALPPPRQPCVCSCPRRSCRLAARSS
jgi:hypothetical protein